MNCAQYLGPRTFLDWSTFNPPAPIIVRLPPPAAALIAPTLGWLLSVPPIVIVACAGVATDPGFGSSTSMSRPKASEQVRR